MANEDKVRFGLRNTKYAVWDGEKYGDLKDFPGAVALSLTHEGTDSSDFYADDGVYHTFSGTNGGYSADLEMARIHDQVRVDLLGEVVDEGTGIQFEDVRAVPKEFALVTEMQLNSGAVGFVFYNCIASRPDLSANTQGENPDVDTDTLRLRITSRRFDFKGVATDVVQSHIQKKSDNADKYSAFFAGVVVPTPSA